MKFGKLPNIEGVDFSMPPTPPFTNKVLRDLPPLGQLNFFIGATGWSMKEWVGKYYPPKTKAKDFLEAYAKQFNTIELNTTYYRIPTEDQVKKWCEKVPDDFRFCPKVSQPISHSANLGLGTPALDQFLIAAQAFGQHMGCCFMQLPPYFGIDRSELLMRLLDHWPEGVPLSIEFRHESWFANPKPFLSILERMQKNNVSTVITDVAGRRDVLHMQVTTQNLVVRFVGNGLHPTDYERIDDWVVRIQSWSQLGLKNVYYFTHEPDNLLSPEIAAYTTSKAKDIPNVIVRGPKEIAPDQLPGHQIKLF